MTKIIMMQKSGRAKWAKLLRNEKKHIVSTLSKGVKNLDDRTSILAQIG